MTWEYIAGFFDGEGSVVFAGKSCRVVISQADLRVLEEIRNFVGYGNISKVSKRKEHWKDAWIYYVARQDEVLDFLDRLRPFLVVKERKVKESLVKLRPRVQNLAEKTSKRKEIRRRVLELRSEGRTLREIGKKVGLDWSYVGRIIRKHGGRSSIG